MSGKQEGVWTSWHGNGQKATEGTYKNNKREGVWTGWRASGQKWGETPHKNGEQEGVSTYWDETGNVGRTEVWEKDVLVEVKVYKNGKLVK